MKQKSSTISVLVGAVILVAIAMVATRVSKKSAAPAQPASQENKNPVANPVIGDQYKKLENSQTSSLFPQGLPLETNAQVLKNFEITIPQENMNQVTRLYVSAKTLQQSFDAYKKYFETSGWTIIETYNADVLKRVSAQKDSAKMFVTAAVQDGKNTVEVTYKITK